MKPVSQLMQNWWIFKIIFIYYFYFLHPRHKWDKYRADQALKRGAGNI